MFEPFAPAIDAFARLLARNYREVFGKAEPDHVPVLRATAKLALERIAATDALYHDELHTLFVADVRARPSCAAAPWSSPSPASAGCTSRSPPCCTTSATCAASARATATAAT